MVPDQIALIADKYLRGEASPEDIQLLHEWYESVDTDETEIIITNDPVTLQQFGANTLEQLKKIIDEEKRYKPKIRRFPGWLGIAAAAAVLIAVAVGGFMWGGEMNNSELVKTNLPSKPANDLTPGENTAVLTLADGSTVALDNTSAESIPQQGSTEIIKLADGQLVYKGTTSEAAIELYNTLTTPKGGQYQVILPDGTKVWLNAASSLKYPTVFIGDDRTVELKGEGYFEVTTNPSKPFIVRTTSSDITVLGTHFNINAYEDEQQFRTTLLEGRVVVSNTNGKFSLHPGQQAGINQHTGKIIVSEADVHQAVAWKNGFFSFDNADLETVMRQISRWYDVEIVYEGEPSKARFVGEVSRNNNASEVLKILELSDVHFRIEGKRIIVRP